MLDLSRLNIRISATVCAGSIEIHPRFNPPEPDVDLSTARGISIELGLCINNRRHGKAKKGGRCTACWESKRANDQLRSGRQIAA